MALVSLTTCTPSIYVRTDMVSRCSCRSVFILIVYYYFNLMFGLIASNVCVCARDDRIFCSMQVKHLSHKVAQVLLMNWQRKRGREGEIEGEIQTNEKFNKNVRCVCGRRAFISTPSARCDHKICTQHTAL